MYVRKTLDHIVHSDVILFVGLPHRVLHDTADVNFARVLVRNLVPSRDHRRHLVVARDDHDLEVSHRPTSCTSPFSVPLVLYCTDFDAHVAMRFRPLQSKNVDSRLGTENKGHQLLAKMGKKYFFDCSGLCSVYHAIKFVLLQAGREAVLGPSSRVELIRWKRPRLVTTSTSSKAWAFRATPSNSFAKTAPRNSFS